MARKYRANRVQKALLFHLLELGQTTLKVLIAESGASRSSAVCNMHSLVALGLATKAACNPDDRPPNRPPATYGISAKGAALAVDFKPADGRADGLPGSILECPL